MKCLLCESLSFHIICQKGLDCIAILPSLRLTQSNLKVYSFYSYQEIAYLLDAKYDGKWADKQKKWDMYAGSGDDTDPNDENWTDQIV